METAIKQKVSSIANCIFTKIQGQQEESFGLYSGGFGLLLFLFYYSRYTKNKKHKLLTEQYAERLFEQFIKKEKLHTFCGGHSGILYLFEFLRENQFIDMDVSVVRPTLDNYIASKMQNDIKMQNYDFMHGALGAGLYFLKKKTNQEQIQELIDFLYSSAEKNIDNKIFKWKSVINFEKNIIGYNIVLSHGISSIVIFLSRLLQNNIVNDKISEVLFGAVNYILSQQIDYQQYGSFFPIQSLENNNSPISKSRLAWCYGDLGVAITLRQAGKVTNNIEWEEKGLNILLHSTRRRSYEESHVADAGICHGSAGIAMIYQRMYLETYMEEFKEATYYWLNQTLNYSCFEDGLAGYKTKYSNRMECDYSLLTGISGIGLVFLSFLEDKQQPWDELFLIS
jgi:hypothetical protein